MLLVGIAVAVGGVLCLGGGIAILTWRIARPEQSARLLPPGLIVTPQPTPTPGVLGTPLAPPPLPADLARLVMLPESEDPSPTPLPHLAQPTATPTPIPTATPTATPSATDILTPSATPRATQTPLAAPMMAPTPLETRPTRTPLPTLPPTLLPSPTAPEPTATPIPPSPTLPAAIPERIVIGRIGLDAPIVPVGQHAIEIAGEVFSQWEVPRQRAAGWHIASGTIGQPGNLVLNGHHNIYGEVFRYLAVLQPGDLVTLEAGGRRYFYVVVQTMTLHEQDQPAEVRQANARWILPTDDERVTLVTCWPYSANTHRLVVIARPLDAVIPPPEIP